MRYIKNLSEAERAALRAGYKQGKSHQFRARCQAILLSAQGYSAQALSSLLQVRELSIYKWFNRFEAGGVPALRNQPGRGRKPLLCIENQVHRQMVSKHIEQDPQRLKVAKAQIEAQLGEPLSESTLKRFLKSLATAGNVSESGLSPYKTQ